MHQKTSNNTGSERTEVLRWGAILHHVDVIEAVILDEVSAKVEDGGVGEVDG